jgi:lysophospholipase L1-like esterase
VQAIEDNLTSMFDLARANGIRVVFASILPISDYERTSAGQQIIQSKRRPPSQITALNAWMKSYAAAHGGIYLDYFSAMADDKGFLREELSEDGLHPNKKGYDIMAPLAEQAIASALNSRS